ncbi:MAG: tRNA (adenosine(37)-N6)-threonylcarbamoyltransferase complex dimerization subunit type 1 TsaB [Planctomycetes bacterium]|nr:tRNA (adenosine(37)-N6)-threonylcarbamoyltransferase complex dimerization subunit type 1 TsaB [Planctomycetota bacterium]MBT4029614.1 tRNA (adenosine(37)-N6)-threonylcarbamoyltransferase complex dimerization subunit type 1 TsaB [Planctomycetota bacterium]MBT4560517.1 tRNA (adenosine(37)-N6)-threonylcarbamoyltransferase complex dimerization subunit type 1 TsaB [Planctomycetota bacterium]MBT5100990.1 tRNA (adenosine(37)-N6)-threonylcarbamoyltransferase complex dimerization subunit type 1 TsaB [
MTGALLAIEQSGREASVAVRFEADAQGRDLHMRFFSGQRGVTLLSEIDDLLKEAGVNKNQLSAVLVGIGPGSYTGLRIACAAARTLSFALEIPCAGVVGFQAKMLEAPLDQTAHFVLDAYRKEIYHASYRRTRDAIETLSAPLILPQEQCDSAVPLGEAFFGDPGLFTDERASLGAQTNPNAAQILDYAAFCGVTLDAPRLEVFENATPLYLRAAAFRSSPKA